MTYTSRQHQDYLKPEEVLEWEKFRIQDTYGIDAVKELLSTLTIDEPCGVMLEFEDVNPNKFAQLVTDAPQYIE